MTSDLGLFAPGLFSPTDDPNALPEAPEPLELPEPFASADLTACIEHGRRVLCWTLTGPGSLHRNRYSDRAWVEITEAEPWRGERLRLYAARYVPGSWMRTSFTDNAQQALRDQLLPEITRYGFARLWAAHCKPDDQAVARAREQAEEARRHAQWHDARARLIELQQAGTLEYIPVPSKPLVRQLVVDYDGRICPEDIAADAQQAGRHVGWITHRGRLIPDGNTLERPTRRRNGSKPA